MAAIFDQVECYPVRVNISERFFAPYRGVLGEQVKIWLDLSNISFYAPTANVAFGLKIAESDGDRTNDIIANAEYGELEGNLYYFEYTPAKDFSYIYLYVRSGSYGYTGVVQLRIEGEGATRTFEYDIPYVVGSSQLKPYGFYKSFDIKKPSTANFGTQSVAFDSGRYYVLHNDSIIQKYSKSGLESELTLTTGSLIHPNDSQFYDGILWVCDTGGGTVAPSIKKVDLASASVVATYFPGKTGWRIAGVTLESDQSFFVVAVQDLPVAQRTELLIQRYDYSTQSVLSEFQIPTDQYYVQGCTLVGRRLYITMNNGNVSLSKFVNVNLDNASVEDVLVVDDFGEAEGLDSIWLDGRLNLITALKQGVFRIPL